MSRPRPNLETLVIHGGDVARIEGALTTPIFQTSTFTDGPSAPPRYTRLSNGPQHLALHARLAAVTGYPQALTAASGMAAIAATLLTHARGGRVFFQRGVYGGTQGLARHHLEALGIGCDVAPEDDVASWRKRLHKNTKVIFVEAISNPLARVIDLAAVVALAREVGALAVIDATFASPVNLAPVDLGFDLELHSATKYLNGHSDVIAGVVCGASELIAPILATQNHLGGVLDPHAAFLLERGMKTMPLRVRRQNESALGLATTLASHPDVVRVHYAGLAPEHVPASVRPHFRGFGGVFAFDLGSAARAEAMMERLRIATPAPSLGGTETLVTRPTITSHAGLTEDEREALGIGPGTVRVACGIEAFDDLARDFLEAVEGRR
jgi:cystathionine gamma-synthase/cystathionine gamma-lyase/cystathionine beta-lyase